METYPGNDLIPRQDGGSGGGSGGGAGNDEQAMFGDQGNYFPTVQGMAVAGGGYHDNEGEGQQQQQQRRWRAGGGAGVKTEEYLQDDYNQDDYNQEADYLQNEYNHDHDHLQNDYNHEHDHRQRLNPAQRKDLPAMHGGYYPGFEQQRQMMNPHEGRGYLGNAGGRQHQHQQQQMRWTAAATAAGNYQQQLAQQFQSHGLQAVPEQWFWNGGISQGHLQPHGMQPGVPGTMTSGYEAHHHHHFHHHADLPTCPPSKSDFTFPPHASAATAITSSSSSVSPLIHPHEATPSSSSVVDDTSSSFTLAHAYPKNQQTFSSSTTTATTAAFSSSPPTHFSSPNLSSSSSSSTATSPHLLADPLLAAAAGTKGINGAHQEPQGSGSKPTSNNCLLQERTRSGDAAAAAEVQAEGEPGGLNGQKGSKGGKDAKTAGLTRREKNTLLERKRKDNINERISEIYQLLPDKGYDQKPQKSVMLVKAINFIKYLQSATKSQQAQAAVDQQRISQLNFALAEAKSKIQHLEAELAQLRGQPSSVSPPLHPVPLSESPFPPQGDLNNAGNALLSSAQLMGKKKRKPEQAVSKDPQSSYISSQAYFDDPGSFMGSPLMMEGSRILFVFVCLVYGTIQPLLSTMDMSTSHATSRILNSVDLPSQGTLVTILGWLLRVVLFSMFGTLAATYENGIQKRSYEAAQEVLEQARLALKKGAADHTQLLVCQGLNLLDRPLPSSLLGYHTAFTRQLIKQGIYKFPFLRKFDRVVLMPLRDHNHETEILAIRFYNTLVESTLVGQKVPQIVVSHCVLSSLNLIESVGSLEGTIDLKVETFSLMSTVALSRLPLMRIISLSQIFLSVAQSSAGNSQKDPKMVHLLQVKGLLQAAEGSPQAAEDTLKSAADLCREQGNERGWRENWTYVGWLHFQYGRRDTADTFQLSLNSAEADGDTFGIWRASVGLASHAIRCGQLMVAEEILARMETLREKTTTQVRDEFQNAFLHSLQAAVHVRQGRYHEGLLKAQSAIENFGQIEISTLANEGLALSFVLDAILLPWGDKLESRILLGKGPQRGTNLKCSENELHSLALTALSLFRKFGGSEHPFYQPPYHIHSATYARLLQLSLDYFPSHRDGVDWDGTEGFTGQLPAVNTVTLQHLCKAKKLADKLSVPYEQGLVRLELVKLAHVFPQTSVTTENFQPLDLMKELGRAIDLFSYCRAERELRQCQELMKQLSSS